MTDLIAFDGTQAKRIADTVRRVEGLRIGDTPGRPEPVAPVELVEITGEKDGETGLYPGEVITYTDEGATRSKNELGECRVHFPDPNGTLLKTGNKLLCRFSGPIDGGDLGLFVPVFPVKVIEVVIDVQCVDGELVVDYEEIVVIDFDIEA